MTKICEKCRNDLDFRDIKLYFKDENNKTLILCKQCYELLTKEKKMKLTYIKGSNSPLARNKEIIASMNRRFGIDFKAQKNEIDKLSINEFNKHIYLVSDVWEFGEIFLEIFYKKYGFKPDDVSLEMFGKKSNECSLRESHQVSKEIKKRIKEKKSYY